MAADKPNGSAPADVADAAPPAAVQARVVAQYIKDLSFENPNVERMITGPGENPNLKLEINVNARRAEDGLFESVIEFRANASNASGTIYLLEIDYGGMFKIENLPANALEPFLLINCPALLFPFLRRLVADITREGGFPPLFIDPIDFGALYLNRQHQAGNPPAAATHEAGTA